MQHLGRTDAGQNGVAEKQHDRRGNDAPARARHAAEKACEQPDAQQEVKISPAVQSFREADPACRAHGVQAGQNNNPCEDKIEH